MPKDRGFSNQKNEVILTLKRAYDLRINDLRQSILLAQRALAQSEAQNDQLLVAESKSKLSLFHMITGDYDTSMKIGHEALVLFQKLNCLKGTADVKYNLAGIHYKTDNYHLGLIYLIDCLEIYQSLDDFHNQARVQKSLGTIYEYFGDQKAAIDSYQKAIETAQKAGEPNLESNAYNPLSGIYINQNQIEKADELIEKSIALKKEHHDTRGLAFALYGKAKVHAARKEYHIAESVFLESINIHEKMGEKLGLTMSAYKLAQLYKLMRQEQKAIDQAMIALDFANENSVQLIKFKSNYLLYEIYRDKGDAQKALHYLELYLKVKEAVINTQTQKVIESYEALTRMERLQKEAQMQREKAEILEKKNRAEESSRIKQEFLSTMSHELRTPLNAVTTIASMLDEKPHNDEEQELIKSLKFSADNLLRIINDILDFSKLENGKVQLEKSPAKISELLTKLCNTYNGMALEKGIKINLDLDPKLNLLYLIDVTKLTQIFGNLMSNAIKYTNMGKVDISVKKEETRGIYDLVSFTVEDTGVGIPEDFLSEIFESFSQPKSFTTRKEGGSGLGLAIVKKLISMHDSDIHVESSLNKGSKFYFTLKLERSKVNLFGNTTVFKKIEGKSVLLAEDNMINAMVSLKLLSNWGIEPKHAKNGEEVLQMCQQESFECILMDIHMPGMDGFQATQMIREQCPNNQNTPIYALTADINASQNQTYSSYFDGFLLKPIEQEKLHGALVTALSPGMSNKIAAQ